MPIDSSHIRAVGMTALISLAAAAACAPATSTTSTTPAAATAAVGAEGRLRADVAYLADDAREGRETGSAGDDSSAVYIARRYARLGLASPLPTADNSACRAAAASDACTASFLQHFTTRSAADAHSGRPERVTQNVTAIIPGTDASLRGQVVVLGAHFDHLGRSTEGALDPQVGDAIRNGADDNASGTAAVMELARRFAANPARRTILVVNFSGEELGLLGSAYFAEHSPVAMDSVQAMLNFDMVGRLRDDRLIVYGIGTATPLRGVLDSSNVAPALKLSPVPDGYGPSDHSSFYAMGVPVLHFFTDVHDDYHRATDDAPLLNYPGLTRVVDFSERVARNLADRNDRLQVIRSAQPSPVAGSARTSGGAVYFGSVPDMGAGDGNGMRLSGVTPGSPADKAGVRTGDVIVQLGDTPITDLYNYTDALRSHKPGDEVDVTLLRDGKRLTVKVKLEARGGS